MDDKKLGTQINNSNVSGSKIPNLSDGLMDELIKLTESIDNISRDILSDSDSDAKVKISVNAKKMEASISVSAPTGNGNHITREMIDSAIDLHGIKYGINDSILDEIVLNQMYDELLPFASGIPAVDGKDGYVENRFSQTKKLIPKLREDGTVDYRDLGMINNIAIGDVICDITNETQGENGIDVYGNEILAKGGKPPIINAGANTGLNGDKSKLIALASGNLIFKSGKFNVDTVFVLNDDVGSGVGNIDFLGDVTINGNVMDGFYVKSSKNIVITGSVSNAVLEAGGSIMVKNGIMNSVIKAQGKVSVAFAENAEINCKELLTVNSLVACKVIVEGDVMCTGKPGVIIGGDTKVVGNVRVNQLGHRSYAQTSISVGNFALLLEEKARLKLEVEQIDLNISQLETTIKYLQDKKKNGEKLTQEKENFLIAALRLKIQKGVLRNPMLHRILEIEEKMTKCDDYTMRISNNVYPNCKIAMGSFILNTSNELGPCFIYTDKTGIQIGH